MRGEAVCRRPVCFAPIQAKPDDSRRGFAIGAESAIGQIEGSATMPFYEHVFIARQDLSQAQVDALAENVDTIVSDHQGIVHKIATRGLKHLANKITKTRKAI